MASPLVTLIDDPTDPLAPCGRHRRRGLCPDGPLISGGVLGGYLHNAYGPGVGVTSTGSVARRPQGRAGVGPGWPSSPAAPAVLADVLAQVGDGLLVTELSGCTPG